MTGRNRFDRRFRALVGLPDVRSVSVLGCALASGSSREWSDAEGHICRRAADKAYDEAGAGPKDMSVAEVHDASAFAEIVQIENLRFCEIGEGGSFSERGETALGGRIPVKGVEDGSIRKVDPKLTVFFFMGSVNWMTR